MTNDIGYSVIQAVQLHIGETLSRMLVAEPPCIPDGVEVSAVTDVLACSLVAAGCCNSFPLPHLFVPIIVLLVTPTDTTSAAMLSISQHRNDRNALYAKP